jgi:hypothetical protein
MSSEGKPAAMGRAPSSGSSKTVSGSAVEQARQISARTVKEISRGHSGNGLLKQGSVGVGSGVDAEDVNRGKLHDVHRLGGLARAHGGRHDHMASVTTVASVRQLTDQMASVRQLTLSGGGAGAADHVVQDCHAAAFRGEMQSFAGAVSSLVMESMRQKVKDQLVQVRVTADDPLCFILLLPQSKITSADNIYFLFYFL